MSNDHPCRAVALISGRGSNLASIIEAIHSQGLPMDLRAVISNRADAGGLLHAKQAGIEAVSIDHRDYEDRRSFDTALQDLIDSFQAELVILAGFMRVLSAGFVHHYQGRMLNIHPSLLPDFPGLNTHQQALNAGAKVHGASIHFVAEQVDGGPVIAQARVPVQDNDSLDELAARVLEQEHRLYPMVLNWYVTGQLRLIDNKPMLNGSPMQQPIVISSATSPIPWNAAEAVA